MAIQSYNKYLYKMFYFIEHKITHLKYTVSPENPIHVWEFNSVIHYVIHCGNVNNTLRKKTEKQSFLNVIFIIIKVTKKMSGK